ncbi:conserved hypothetical protein [Luminiphilus syltensis NOR5-1B]|uniref:UPF0033 domain-containing protein n=1 Tax=Luminiphilus syltensis NOR5-1B TaxID=565045 RepID=B8KWW7_9GAMM|nr:sulfurtransferase TusA family protein [Luminiphilus syltensis]EED36921.1 conserved hypothetical protein [Luminiphilus syltensis NOR5-1B]
MSETADPTADAVTVDARDQRCPMPLLLAKRALMGLDPGAVLVVLATDPGSSRDFAAFAAIAGHQVETNYWSEGVLRHLITKGPLNV